LWTDFRSQANISRRNYNRNTCFPINPEAPRS
jgi:hypothetical protein